MMEAMIKAYMPCHHHLPSGNSVMLSTLLLFPTNHLPGETHTRGYNEIIKIKGNKNTTMTTTNKRRHRSCNQTLNTIRRKGSHSGFPSKKCDSDLEPP